MVMMWSMTVQGTSNQRDKIRTYPSPSNTTMQRCLLFPTHQHLLHMKCSTSNAVWIDCEDGNVYLIFSASSVGHFGVLQEWPGFCPHTEPILRAGVKPNDLSYSATPTFGHFRAALYLLTKVANHGKKPWQGLTRKLESKNILVVSKRDIYKCGIRLCRILMGT